MRGKEPVNHHLQTQSSDSAIQSLMLPKGIEAHQVMWLMVYRWYVAINI